MTTSTKIERAFALVLFALSSIIVLRVGYIAVWLWWTGTHSYTATGVDGHLLVLIFLAGFAQWFDMGCRALVTIITGKPYE